MKRNIKVILDKSFLQAEPRDSRRLKVLAQSGCDFVLTDTLVYELCSGEDPNQWVAAQRKLFPFADRIESWRHVGELLAEEVENQKPTSTPVYEEATRWYRNRFKMKEFFVPENLVEAVEKIREQREVHSADALLDWCTKAAELD